MSEHKLNDQWIEGGRMYKATAGKNNCLGCSLDNGSVMCGYKNIIKCGEGQNFIIKDLGPVDDNGCLAEERTGLFPVVKQDGPMWFVEMHTSLINVLCIGRTMQQVIDRWNQRCAL